MNRVGPQMARAIRIIKDNPGCTKKFVAEKISPHPIPEKNWGIGYAPIDRCIEKGLVQAKRKHGRYYLYVKER